MIQFIYGNNRYGIQEKLHKIEADFLKLDPSAMNLEKIEGTTLALGKFDQAVSTMPFLAPKRLVIITGFLTEHKDADFKTTLVDGLGNISNSDTTDLIFVEYGEPDKRLRAFKQLLKISQVTEARELEGMDLIRWVCTQFQERQIKCASKEAQFLIAEVGSDMQRLINECEKISLYIKSQSQDVLSSRDISLLIAPGVDPNIFQFCEALARKDAKTATQLLFQFSENGESEQKLFGMLAYQYRTLLIIRDCLDRGMANNEISQQAKVSPFVLNKNISLARSQSMKYLVSAYDQLRRTDSAIKSGEVAPELATGLLVLTLCR